MLIEFLVELKVRLEVIGSYQLKLVLGIAQLKGLEVLLEGLESALLVYLIAEETQFDILAFLLQCLLQ